MLLKFGLWLLHFLCFLFIFNCLNLLFIIRLSYIFRFYKFFHYFFSLLLNPFQLFFYFWFFCQLWVPSLLVFSISQHGLNLSFPSSLFSPKALFRFNNLSFISSFSIESNLSFHLYQLFLTFFKSFSYWLNILKAFQLLILPYLNS